MTILHIGDYPYIKSKFTTEPLGDVIPLSWWQETTEKLLMCQHCKDVWIDILPTAFPVHLLECEVCMRKGGVIASIPRRLR